MGLVLGGQSRESENAYIQARGCDGDYLGPLRLNNGCTFDHDETPAAFVSGPSATPAICAKALAAPVAQFLPVSFEIGQSFAQGFDHVAQIGCVGASRRQVFNAFLMLKDAALSVGDLRVQFGDLSRDIGRRHV